MTSRAAGLGTRSAGGALAARSVDRGPRTAPPGLVRPGAVPRGAVPSALRRAVGLAPPALRPPARAGAHRRARPWTGSTSLGTPASDAGPNSVRPVDKLLAVWLAGAPWIVLARGTALLPRDAVLLCVHALLAGLLARWTRRARPGLRRDLYPLLLYLPLYLELGLWNRALDPVVLAAHDARIQSLEEALFGGQPSLGWIVAQPSPLFSGLMHLAYLSFYPLVCGVPLALWLAGLRAGARAVVLATTAAFALCHAVFLLYPVAGPYYAFRAPSGPARQVACARAVHALLELGSSVGTAFPSSHVAAATAVLVAAAGVRRSLAAVLAPAVLALAAATVYCRMHYASDAAAGLLVGAGAALGAARFRDRPRDGTERPLESGR